MSGQRSKNRGLKVRAHMVSAAAAAIALAASTAVAPAATKTYTWVGGNSGDPNNFNEPLNWNPNAVPGSDPTGTSDVADFNNTPTYQPILTANTTISALEFDTSGWMLGADPAGTTLTLTGVSGTGFQGTLGVLSNATSGINQIGANVAISGGESWEIATGGTVEMDGVLSVATGTPTLAFGAGAIQTGNLVTPANAFAGTALFTNNNTFAGSMTIDSGTVELGGATVSGTAQWGTLSAVPTINLAGGTLGINNTTAAGGNFNNRLNPAATLNFWGGSSLVYVGADASGTSSSDAVSATNLDSAFNTVTVTANGGNAATLNLGTLTRNPNTATLFVNGLNLGTTGGQLLTVNAPPVVGTTPGTVTDNAGTFNTQIVPFMVGESGTAPGAGGTATGTPNTLVTAYTLGSNTAYRPLNPTDEFTHNAIATGNNTYITTATTSAGTDAINSLVINGGDLTIADGTTLTDTSGALLFTTSNTIKPSGTTGTLDFSTNEGIITVAGGATATITAPMTAGTAGITETGPGTLRFTTSNPYAGNLYVGGNVQLGDGANSANDGNFPSATGLLINDGGTLTIADAAATTIATPITFVATPGSLGSSSATLLISGPGAVTFNGQFNRTNGGFPYVESTTAAPVTFNNTLNVGGLRFYAGGTDMSGAPLGSNANPVTWTFTSSSAINGGGTSAFSNNNFGTGATPSPVQFNVNGTIAAGTLYVGYLGGTVLANFNNTVTASSLLSAYSSNTPGNDATPYAVINLSTAASAVTTQTAVLAYNEGSTQYLGINNGGSLTVANATATSNTFKFFAANEGNSLIELGALNNASSTGTINFGTNYAPTGTASMPAIIFNGGTTAAGAQVADEHSELNVFAGGSVNIGIQPAAGVTGGSPGGSGGINAGYLPGQTFVLNVQGGTINNFAGNAPVFLVQNGGKNSGGGNNVYSVLNINSDANGNMGKVITSYVRAFPNPDSGTDATTGAADNGATGAFINFNGGELEYNNTTNAGGANSFNGNSGKNSNGIPNNGLTGGMFVFPKGAIIGSNALGSSVPGGTVNIDHPLLAPLGNGVTFIPVANGGTGYLSPPIVQITDSTGADATAVATLTNGVVTGITITSPGINYSSSPTITLIGGSPTTAATIGTATVAANDMTGGLTKVDNGTLNLTGGWWYPTPGQFSTSQAALPLAQNTYGGPTTIVAGTLGLNGTYSATNNIIVETNTAPNAATLQINQPTTLNGLSTTATPPTLFQVNNNAPLAAAIVVGDVPAGTVVNGNTLTNTGTFQITATGTAGFSGFALGGNQVLSGFGTVKGSSTEGLNLGQAPSGTVAGGITSLANPSPTQVALTGTGSVISPGYVTSATALILPNNTSSGNGGYQPNSGYGAVVMGTANTGTTPTVTFGTKLGNAATISAPTATGALTLGGGTSMTTSLGGSGTYYWKLDLSNGGAGATTTPGSATVSPGLTANAPAAGAAWDQLILDAVTPNSTIGADPNAGSTNAFTVQAVSFISGSTVPGGSAIPSGALGTTPYSWVIARVNQTYNATSAQALLAGLSLDITGMPATANGWSYFLSAQGDPGSASATDLVVNYAPVPEPTSVALLGLGAAGLMLRRRRRSLAK